MFGSFKTYTWGSNWVRSQTWEVHLSDFRVTSLLVLYIKVKVKVKVEYEVLQTVSINLFGPRSCFRPQRTSYETKQTKSSLFTLSLKWIRCIYLLFDWIRACFFNVVCYYSNMFQKGFKVKGVKLGSMEKKPSVHHCQDHETVMTRMRTWKTQ